MSFVEDIVSSVDSIPFRPFFRYRQLLVEETAELVEASLSAVRADLAERPAWNGAPSPSDDFLLMFLRAEVFNPKLAAVRYRRFWQVLIKVAYDDSVSAV